MKVVKRGLKPQISADLRLKKLLRYFGFLICRGFDE